MQQDSDGLGTVMSIHPLAQTVQHLAALAGVGGVHVVERCLASVTLNIADDSVDVRHRGAAVEVDAGDVHACFCQGDCAGCAEA